MRILQNTGLRALMGIIAFGLILTSSSTAAPDVRGLIEIDYADAMSEPRTEINLRGPMLALLAKGIRERNPDGSEFLMSLTAAKVRVYNRSALGGRFDAIRNFYRQQMSIEWQTLTRTKENGISFGIYSLAEGDIVSGLVVLVANELKGEFAVVNLAGKIDITKLSQLDKITGANVALPAFDFENEKLSPEQRKLQTDQRQKAIANFLSGNQYQAIAILEKIEEEGISSKADYALMATLYHSMGALDKSYYYLGMLYEIQKEADTARSFYEKAVDVNPESAAADKLGRR